MARAITIVKIDPGRRQISRMSIVPSVKGVRSIIGCSKIGHRVLLEDVKGERLLVAARVGQPPEKMHPEWRIRGTENTVGVGFLFGTLNRAMDGMWHCPVDLEWVKSNVVWCEPGENAPAAEVAEVQGIPLLTEALPGGEAAEGSQLEAQKAPGPEGADADRQGEGGGGGEAPLDPSEG